MAVEKARIGKGTALFVVGAIIIAFGVLLTAGQSGAGLGFTLFGASLVAVGFWSRLFYLIERRLIDIQAAIVSPAGLVETRSTAAPERKTADPAAEFLG